MIRVFRLSVVSVKRSFFRVLKRDICSKQFDGGELSREFLILRSSDLFEWFGVLRFQDKTGYACGRLQDAAAMRPAGYAPFGSYRINCRIMKGQCFERKSRLRRASVINTALGPAGGPSCCIYDACFSHPWRDGKKFAGRKRVRRGYPDVPCSYKIARVNHRIRRKLV